MITIILTLDESRKDFQSVIDENSKKVDENHNNPKKSTLSKFEPKQIVLEYHKMKSIILTLDESRKTLKFVLKIDENRQIDERYERHKK